MVPNFATDYYIVKIGSLFMFYMSKYIALFYNMQLMSQTFKHIRKFWKCQQQIVKAFSSFNKKNFKNSKINVIPQYSYTLIAQILDK